MVLNVHGTQVLQEIVPSVGTNGFWTVTSHKRHFYYDFVIKDQESTLRKIPKCGFGELLGR